ncbi:hypothetical protein AWN88_25610 [Agrobacterium tumefaciens]|nr:hypothetical protein AWN88_25610 [Agrobacterium tumefaciens]KAJ36297.1 hypothetical protein BW45_23010 [Agrobacterium tumefaciens]
METLGSSSEVQAVSELLAAIGEDPVENLEDLPPSGNTALVTLRGTSRDLQEEGHWFNSEDDYVIEPNEGGEIIIPESILSIDSPDLDVIQRGRKLYNRETKTFTFDSALTCSVILQLEWDELPSVARRYITALAIERFVDGFPGATAVTEARNRNLLRAKVAFDKAELRNGDYNLLDNESIQQKNRRG